MKSAIASRKESQGGFTLVELMIAIAITVIVMAGLMTVFSSQQRSFAQQAEIANSQSAARSSLFIMSRDIRLAGYTGIPSSVANMTKSSVLPGNTLWPVISLRNDGSVIAQPSRSKGVGDALSATATGDAIEVWGNFRRSKAYLTTAIGPGTTSLSVSEVSIFSSAGSKFNRPGWIVIGDGGDNAEFHALSGNTIANPLTISTGVNTAYQVGAFVVPFYRRIYYVQKNTAAATATPNPTLIARNCLSTSCTASNDYAELTMAEGMENLQFEYESYNPVGPSISTGAGVITDPCRLRNVKVILYAGLYAYRTSTLTREFSTTVRVRNLGLTGSGATCPIPGL